MINHAIACLVCLAGAAFAFSAVPTDEPIATPSQVLVLYNSAYRTDADANGVQDSIQIAFYYKLKRNIPSRNVIGIPMPLSETISRAQYNTAIKAPLESRLITTGLRDSIKYIALCKGTPLRISATNGREHGITDYASVDASVMLLFEDYDITWQLENPYFEADPQVTKRFRFRTNHFRQGNVTLRYLATRLDGYKPEHIMQMIDRAVRADTSGNALWLMDDHQRPYDVMPQAHEKLKELGMKPFPDPWENTKEHITCAPGPVIGYVGHGWHATHIDGYYSSLLKSLRYANGAVTCTYESFNAIGFLSPGQSSHGQLAEFIVQGGCGGIGNCYEPWESSIAQETIWMPAYAVGYTWADAAHMSLPHMDFVSVVVGDPLMVVGRNVPAKMGVALTATPDNGKARLSWRPLKGTPLGVMIVRNEKAYPTSSRDGVVVYDGPNDNFTDGGLDNGRTYYYVAFPYNRWRNVARPTRSGRTPVTPYPVEVKMKIERYPSSLDKHLELYAEFYVPDAPRPLAIFFHGWHMRAEQSRPSVDELVAAGYFVVNVDMRGRAKCSGKPDAGGLELMDGLDAMDYALRTWPDKVDLHRGPYLVGGSGGGGNTMTLVGKAPDRFAAAVSWAGMSDYAVWYEDDPRGRYRDEMTDKGWIGGTPETNPEAYRSRGGVHVIGNLLTPILIIHGTADTSVPVHHALSYQQAAFRVRKSIDLLLNDRGHDSIDWPKALAFLTKSSKPPMLPQTGSLVFASFLATRAFRLAADSPDVMGKVAYTLDERGRLETLQFSRDGYTAPLKTMTLYLPDTEHGPARIRVTEGRATISPLESPLPGWQRWDVAGASPWTMQTESH